MQNRLTHINAYILTGGKSRRMRTDKSLIKVNSLTLTEIIYQKLYKIFKNVFIVGKQNNFLSIPFVQDFNKVQCPLNGITTALDHSQDNWIFIIACDMPMVQNDTIINLFDDSDTSIDAIVPTIKSTEQPVCAFYRTDVIPLFKDSIENGELSLKTILKKINILKISIDLATASQFLNINNINDLKKAESYLSNFEKNRYGRTA